MTEAIKRAMLVQSEAFVRPETPSPMPVTGLQTWMQSPTSTVPSTSPPVLDIFNNPFVQVQQPARIVVLRLPTGSTDVLQLNDGNTVILFPSLPHVAWLHHMLNTYLLLNVPVHTEGGFAILRRELLRLR